MHALTSPHRLNPLLQALFGRRFLARRVVTHASDALSIAAGSHEMLSYSLVEVKYPRTHSKIQGRASEELEPTGGNVPIRRDVIECGETSEEKSTTLEDFICRRL